MSDVKHLIISSSIDFATDYICIELQKRKEQYLRINRDQFNQYKVCFNSFDKELTIENGASHYFINDGTLKSVYFRAPVFIRSNKDYTVEQQVYRSQWSAFIRNISVFDHAKWINSPEKTFQAENKMLQLGIAKKIGMDVPKTVVSNYFSDSLANDFGSCHLYAVKALDTALFYDNNTEEEYFTYTQILTKEELLKESLQEAPVFIQECISNKTDIRVTIIGEKLFASKITKDGKGIDGDWRHNPKETLQYSKCQLPRGLEIKIIKIMRALGLNFGGMDLAYSNGKYYFIEVNPTGEWAWLMKPTGYPISKEIVNFMVK